MVANSRRRLALVVLGAVVASSAVGWVAGSRISSPAEVAARTQPPPASPILVPAEQRVLSADVVTRGTARYGSPQQLILAPSALKLNPGVATELPAPGTALGEGDLLLTASSRPVLVLQGLRPSFRDLGPGLEGEDVRQLEEALVRLGFDPGAADGTYDGVTEQAVAAFYRDRGFEPFTATEDQLATISSREAELTQARIDLLGADDAVAAAAADVVTTAAQEQASGSASGIDWVGLAGMEARSADAAAEARVAAAQAALDELVAGTPAQPGTAAEIAAAEAALGAATADAAAARLSGEQAVAQAQAERDAAPAAVEVARAEAQAADAAAAVEVETHRLELEGLRNDPDANPAAIAAAEAELAAAEARAAETRLAGQRTVAEAGAGVAAAVAGLEAARSQAAAADAEAAGAVAARQAELNTLRSGAPVTPATRAELASATADLREAEAALLASRGAGRRLVASAQAELRSTDAATTAANRVLANALEAVRLRAAANELLAADLDLSRRRAGVQVPADELVFVRTAPIRTAEVSVALGDQVSGPVMTATDTSVAVDGSLALEDAALVEQGMTVQIEEPDLGISAAGRVSQVAGAPGTNGVDGFHIWFEVLVDAPPPNLVGASVRLTVPIESSGGDVLAVPVSAVTLAPDGSSRVQVGDRFVAVEPGLSAEGFVAITPLDGTVGPGDLVVVGFDEPGQATPVPAPSPSASGA